MKTLSQIFADRGDPWTTEREQDKAAELAALHAGRFRPADTLRWLVTMPSGAQVTVTNYAKLAAFKRAGFKVRQVGWDRPERDKRLASTGQSFDYSFAKTKRERRSDMTGKPDRASRDVCRIKPAQVIQKVRRKYYGTPSHTRYRVSWLDRRYSETFHSLERAEEKIALLVLHGIDTRPTLETEERR